MKRWSLLVGMLGVFGLACMGGGDAPPPPDEQPPPPPGPDAPADEVQEAQPVVVLDALVGTSGDATALVDGQDSSAWKPYGDPVGEGLLVRFSAPTSLGQLELHPCPGSAAATLRLFVNGAQVEQEVGFAPGQAALWGGEALQEPVRSLFLKVEEAQGPLCADALRMLEPGGAPMNLAPHATVPGEIQVSSTLAPADAYHAAYLFDRRTDFGWVEGASGLGVGETLTLSFDREVHASALEIANGYQRSADHFEKNARVAELALRVDGGEPVTLAVADTQGAQRIEFPEHLQGKRWELEITKATPGTRYEDLVISELRLVEGDQPCGLATTDLATRQEDLLQSLSGKPLREVVDRHLVSLCGEGAGLQGSLKLRSNQSFVRYEEFDGDGEDSQEVFDGAWVVSSLGTPWSTLKLYGRRHSIATEWMPYQDDLKVESTRISGGAVEVARVEDLGPEAFEAVLRTDIHLFCPDYDTLVQRHAVVVKGKPLADILGDAAP